MYSLMMMYDPEAWDTGIAGWPIDRYLEYTDDGLKARFETVTDAVVSELKTLPTLFAHELQTEKPARVGWITSIERRASSNEVRVRFEMDPEIPPVDADTLRKMLAHLDIDARGEAHRTHWAVKDVDLIAVLRRFKVISARATIDPAAFRFSRQTVIKACDLLRGLGHAGFDALLLDIGVDNIDAGRDKGSLQARSVALGAYVVAHLDDHTVDGEPLAYAVVRRAAESDPHYSEADDSGNPLRAAFWSNLKRDGYGFEDGCLTSVEGGPAPTQRPYSLHHPISERPVITASHLISARPAAFSGRPRVFIVHGRSAAPKNEVALFLHRIGLDPVILHEQPNGGRTLIAKFQDESADVVFAIVLMTPDDEGGLKGGAQASRARQNVIFELGFFIGRLGASKVCALVQGDIEKPSDFDAVVYVPYDAAGAWKNELARELRYAKVPFDAHAVF